MVVIKSAIGKSIFYLYGIYNNNVSRDSTHIHF